LKMDKKEKLMIETIEMHTGGEPLRIITSGYPEISGKTILEKRRYLKNNLDHIRRFLMLEPRGHFDQYGGLLVKPDHPEAHIAVIFMHNEGYSTMCGHAIFALGRFAVDYGYVKHPSREGEDGISYYNVNIQCPCGLVRAEVEVQNGKSGAVRFVSVPAFAVATDVKVPTEKYGTVVLDIGYGGAFYALIRDQALGLNVTESSLNNLIDAADHISNAVKKHIRIHHPEEDDLSFLYGTIITDGKDDFSDEMTSNLCVFANRQVDRCPTGSGVTARIAVQHAKSLIKLGDERVFENGITHSTFTGKAVEKTTCGSYDAVRVEVSGRAFYTGKSTFTCEDEDPLKNGFLLN